jgi:hypothetical protein
LYTDEDCVGGNGTITVDVTNANGNTLEFSIDGGLTFSNSPVFTGLDAGDYQVLVQYSIAGDICATDVADVTIAPAVTITADVAISTEYSCTTPGTITVGNVLGRNSSL